MVGQETETMTNQDQKDNVRSGETKYNIVKLPIDILLHDPNIRTVRNISILFQVHSFSMNKAYLLWVVSVYYYNIYLSRVYHR